ncbi:MAG: hypothetical protein QOE77_1965 [Blastocatellia bacterium]|jgi:hypothetical protein|nr:hypothetical protein [Blastocatellia bacterium]
MRRLIKRVNEQPTSEPNPLKQLLKAFHAKKQGKGLPSVAVTSLSQVTVNLADYSVRVRSELELALQEIDLPNMVDLIRECPVATCGRLFWVGRSDKTACDEHGELWRKRENRRDKKERKSEAKRTESLNRREEEAKKALGEMSKTAMAIIRVIMGVSERPRLFWEIDWWVAYQHREGGEVIRSTKVVRQTINKLVKDGYLTYAESAEADEDRYEPRQKLVDLWPELSKLATH